MNQMIKSKSKSERYNGEISKIKMYFSCYIAIKYTGIKVFYIVLKFIVKNFRCQCFKFFF